MTLRSSAGWTSALLLLAAVRSVLAQSSPEIDLQGVTSTTQLIRIEMENFVLPGAVGEAPPWMRELDDVLFQDLDYADLFETTRWFRYPGEPAYPNSRALVRGVIERAGGGWVLRGRVEGLPGNDLIFQNEYPFTRLGARDAVHRFADDVVARLTGQVGIARTRIAFARQAGPNNKELWVVDPDGEDLQQLSFDGTLNLSPKWDPRGGRLYFMSYRRGRTDIGVLEVATGQVQHLDVGAGLNSTPVPSPDGATILFTKSVDGGSNLYTVRTDGTGARRLTSSRGIDTSPSWSPDGERIAFVSDRAGSPQIYVMDRAGRNLHRLTLAGNYNAAPAWSPRGDRIAFVSRDGYVLNIYVMSVDGRAIRPVVYGKGDCENPSWAPDGRHLVYSALRGDERRLYVIDVETGRDRALTTGSGDCYGPTWSTVPRQ